MADPKIGVIHYNWPNYDLEGFVRRASEIGYQYCELSIRDIWDGVSTNGQETAARTRELLSRYGMQASAVDAGNDFLQADPADLAAQIQRYRYVCQIIPHAGTDIVRSDGGWNRQGKVPQDLWDGMLVESFKRVADYLEESDVRCALDNHGTSTNDGDWQLSLIERVGSKRLGVNVDTMNYRWYGHDLDKIDHFYQILAPHVFHVHMKDGTNDQPRGGNYKGAALGAGEIHLEYAIKVFREAGYEGAWTAEYEGPEAEGGVGYEKCYRWLQSHL